MVEHRIIGVEPGIIFTPHLKPGEHVRVDLRVIDDATAATLLSNGCPYIQKINSRRKAKDKEIG